MPSPICEVKDGGGAYQPTTFGVDVTPGNVITIRLADQTDVDSWTVYCLTTDELGDKAAINLALVIDNPTKTATFTAPAATFGRTYRFLSRINNGKDANFIERDDYTTTFGIYLPTIGGYRTLAVDERLEGDPEFGWIVSINEAIRTPPIGEVNTASNVGAGAQVYKEKIGADLRFRSIVSGSPANLPVTQNTNDVTITLNSTLTGIASVAFTGTPATTGTFRHSLGDSARARNFANTNDLSIWETNASELLGIGTDLSFTAAKQFAQVSIYSSPSGIVYLGNGGTTRVRLDSSGMTMYADDAIIWGISNPALSGKMRFAYNGGVAMKVMQFRDNVNSTDFNFLTYGAGHTFIVGSTQCNMNVDSFAMQLVANGGGFANYHNTGFDVYNYTRAAYDFRINATGFNLNTKPGGKAADRTTIGHRLTLTSATPFTTADVTGATTIYLTPHVSNQIALYDGTDWWQYEVNEISLALGTLTSGANYDVFVYNNAGTITLELTAWTNNTTRATALTRQDGVLVKTGALTRRYIGTIRTTSTTTTEDSLLKRFVWNMYNRVERFLYAQDTTASWAYAGAAWRQVRATAANKVEAVFGLASPVTGSTFIMWNGAAGTGVALYTGVGLDSTTVLATGCVITTMLMPTLVAQYWWPSSSVYDANVVEGYHAFNWIEYAHATGLTGLGTVGFSQSHIRMRISM